MTRTANAKRPEELLEEVTAYLTRNGIAELSLRPLAKAVGSSPRVLLYYFGSKEELVVMALARMRERQRVTYERMKSLPFETPREACRAIWQHMSAPENEKLFRMSLEIFAMALRQPQKFAEYLRATIEDWLGFLSAPLEKKGYSKDEARAHATVVLSGFRGFMLDYCASRDRARLDRAVELWLHALDAIPLRKENPNGE
ncbi:MAG TPA: TetR/AcrR family transcriptional regulator [Candidatus Solibacter sp.]|nr:TetR/AcrR family transcriptional regulator [Candidatus Solibacter sp.]